MTTRLSDETLKRLGVPIAVREVSAKSVLMGFQPAPPGLPSGWASFDTALNNGLRPGLYVLTGGTSIGKSAFAIALTRQISQRVPVTVIAAELGKVETAARLVAPFVNRPWIEILESGGSRELANALGNLQVNLLDIDPDTGADAQLDSLRPCNLLVVDYLQYWARVETGEPTRAGVAAMSHRLATWAAARGTCVLALSDIARHLYDKDDKHTATMVGAPKDSGEVEYDAVGLLHFEAEPNDPVVGIRVTKHKFGPRDTRVGFQFDPELNVFLEDDLVGESPVLVRAIRAIANGCTSADAVRDALKIGRAKTLATIKILEEKQLVKRVGRGRLQLTNDPVLEQYLT